MYQMRMLRARLSFGIATMALVLGGVFSLPLGAEVYVLDSRQGGEAFCNPKLPGPEGDVTLERAWVYGHLADLQKFVSSFGAPSCTSCVLALSSNASIHADVARRAKPVAEGSAFADLKRGQIVMVIENPEEFAQALAVQSKALALAVPLSSSGQGPPGGQRPEPELGGEAASDQTSCDAECCVKKLCVGEEGVSFELCCGENVCVEVATSGELELELSAGAVSFSVGGK